MVDLTSLYKSQYCSLGQDQAPIAWLESALDLRVTAKETSYSNQMVKTFFRVSYECLFKIPDTDQIYFDSIRIFRIKGFFLHWQNFWLIARFQKIFIRLEMAKRWKFVISLNSKADNPSSDIKSLQDAEKHLVAPSIEAHLWATITSFMKIPL